MDLHDRYMKISTTMDFSMFELFDSEFEDDPFPLLHRLIKRYNDRLTEDDRSPASRSNTLRTLLCYEYGLVFDAKSRNGTSPPNDSCIESVKNSPLARSDDEFRRRFTDHAVLFDVLILRLTLHCDAECGARHLVDFCESYAVPDGDESRSSRRLKILECFLEASRLKAILNKDDPRFDSTWRSFGPTYLREVTSWLRANAHGELRPFASILPKLLDAFGPDYVLPELCASVLNGLDDVRDSLCVLGVLTDVSVNTEGARSALERLYRTESLWSLIMKSLGSSAQQCRKQGMFVMKRMTGLNLVGVQTRSSSAEIVPFLCGESPGTRIPIGRVKEDFFLIMEALEEKQHHLVVPALRRLTTLVEGSIDHSSCNDCFGDAWVRLVFERILGHWNPAVVKRGISYACELPVLLRDRRFLGLFVHALNNTFLYERRVGRRREPETFDDVVKLFVASQGQRAEFLSQVLRALAEETWAPVPLFYALRALRTASSEAAATSHWGDEELTVVARLTRTSLNVGTKHPRNFNVLNGASQIELLRTVALAADGVTDLKSAASAILAFPATLSRNVAGPWLRKIATREGLANFLRDVCSGYSRPDPPTTLSPTDFAVLVVAFCDAGLMSDKTDDSWAILSDWLSSLENVDARPYADVAPTLRAMEFLSEFVEPSGVARIPERVRKLSSLYVRDAMKFLYKNTRSIPYRSSYEQTCRYFVVITKFLNDGNCLLRGREISDYARKFVDECTIVLGDERRTSLHSLYALKILHHAQGILSETRASFYRGPLSNVRDVRSFDDVEPELRGAVASDYYKTLARLVYQYLSRVDARSWPVEVDWFACVSHLHEMGGNEIVPEVAPILRTIVDKGSARDPENGLKLRSTLTGIWRSTVISTKNYFYFSGMKSLVRVVVNNNFLVEPSVMSFVDKLLAELIEEGDRAPRLKKYLLNEMNSLDASRLNDLQEPLLACLLHGDVLGRDKRIESQAYSYIAENHEDYCFQGLKTTDYYDDDADVRATAVTLLHRVLDEDATYGSKFLPRLLKRLNEYRDKRYYHHSYVHKVKHRIMQVLLIIQPTLTKEDALALQEYLCDAILVESNQHSVRLMQEWTLVRIYLQYTDLHEGLWTFFEKVASQASS